MISGLWRRLMAAPVLHLSPPAGRRSPRQARPMGGVAAGRCLGREALPSDPFPLAEEGSAGLGHDNLRYQIVNNLYYKIRRLLRSRRPKPDPPPTVANTCRSPGAPTATPCVRGRNRCP